MNDPPMTNIGTDLFDNFGSFDDDEEPLDSGPVIPDIMKEEVAQTVVSIENEMDGNDGNDEAGAFLETTVSATSPHNISTRRTGPAVHLHGPLFPVPPPRCWQRHLYGSTPGAQRVKFFH